MTLRLYLADKRYLILFFVLLMGLISLVVYLAASIPISISNLLYLNLVGYVSFGIYMLGGYFFRVNYYHRMIDTMKNLDGDIINGLPKPVTYEQSLYHELLKKLYNEQNKKIMQLYQEKKENLEYTTSWVHEVKTPIAVSRLVIENSSDKSKEDICKNIEEELDKIESQVDNALYYSRIDAFSKDFFIYDLNLARIVKDTIKKNAKTFINKKIKLVLQDFSLDVITDKKWLSFILDQILSNALKYTDVSGEINIYLEGDKKEKRLVIEDNGIGIKPEDIGRVFDKGFTGYTGREHSKATGMGLYMAKKLAVKLGHQLSIESKYGEYTRVKIHFFKVIDYYNVTKP